MCSTIYHVLTMLGKKSSEFLLWSCLRLSGSGSISCLSPRKNRLNKALTSRCFVIGPIGKVHGMCVCSLLSAACLLELFA